MQPQNPDSQEPLQPELTPSTSPHQAGDIITPMPQPTSNTSLNDSALLAAQTPEPTHLPIAPANFSSAESLPSSLPSQPLMSASSMQQEEQKTSRHLKLPKKVVTILAVLLILGGGSAAAYFGYFVPNKPPNVWRTALTNTGKGYDKLSQYATSKKNTNSISAKGSFKLSGSVAADGTFNGLSDGKNGQFSGSTSVVGLKINYDVRAINSAGNTPDIYFKIDGLQGLGSLVGSYVSDSEKTAITQALNGLNGKWYFVDHTLFDQFAQSTNSDLQFSSKDVDEVLKAVGDASKQYLFTSDSEKMAIVVKQYVGKEKQDGNSVYHYKVGVNKENLQAYNKALCNNLAKTKLFKLFSGSAGDVDLIQQCQDTTGLNKIDSSRTADAWVDLHTKLIHKIRFTQKSNANNYTEIAQNYKGGSEFPFSIGFHDQTSVDNGIIVQNKSKPDTSSGLINMKLNMKTNIFTMNANFESTGTTNSKGIFNLTVAPSSQAVRVGKPTGAKTIIELLNDLGLGSVLSDGSGSASSASASAKDTERKADINALQAQIEAYNADNNGHYPTLANLNDTNWRKANMPELSDAALKDPAGAQPKIVAKPTAKAYAYQPSPANCNNNGVDCASYILTATLDNGSTYVKNSF